MKTEAAVEEAKKKKICARSDLGSLSSSIKHNIITNNKMSSFQLTDESDNDQDSVLEFERLESTLPPALKRSASSLLEAIQASPQLYCTILFHNLGTTTLMMSLA